MSDLHITHREKNMSDNKEVHGSAEHLDLLGNTKTNYPTEPSPETLERIPWKGGDSTVVILQCPEYTCACPKTGQPDFATILIQYVPDEYLVESKALKIYLFSFRNHGHFHEVGIDRIAREIYECITPRFIRVIGDFNKRGGISIVPITELGDPNWSSKIPLPKIEYGQ